MSIATIGDVLGASHPVTENCPHCLGLGVRVNLYIAIPITCADCGGTGKVAVNAGVAETAPEPSRPGLGDEIRPDLMTKKLRSW